MSGDLNLLPIGSKVKEQNPLITSCCAEYWTWHCEAHFTREELIPTAWLGVYLKGEKKSKKNTKAITATGLADQRDKV